MKRLKNMSFKHIIAISFFAFVFVCGVLTLTVNFKEVFGGLVRGFIKMPKDSNVSEKISNSLSTFDTRMNEFFILHDVSMNSYGTIQKAMDKHLIDDVDPNYNVVKLKNDYLTFKENDNADWSGLKDYLHDLKTVCNNNSVNMLYVNKLGKSTYDLDLLPDYFPYRYSADFSKIKLELESSGIDVLDLEQVVKNEGMDKYSFFYKTDHHWTTKAGLWASNQIANRLNAKYDYKINCQKLNIENYVVESHNNFFLGTQGRRTGAGYTELDDFDNIYPNFPTNIEYTVNNKKIRLSGDFQHTIFYQKDIKDGYGMYMPSRYDLVAFHNKESNNGKYAVFVVDSFGSVVAPFLSQTFERMECIDLRYFSDDLGEYIEKNKPDVVIYMVDWTDAVLHQDVI